MELEGAGRNESVAKAFLVLEVIARSAGAGVHTGEIAGGAGLPRSTALRILGSLLEIGAVSRLPDRTWVIGPAIGRLASSSSAILRLRDLVHSELQAVTQRLQETSMIGIAVGPATARIIDEVEGPRLLGVRSRWVDRVIDHSASGFVRTLLAEMPPEAVRARLSAMSHPQRTPSTKTSVEDLVAAIDRIREDGHSAVVNELEEGIAGVGVPVRGADGALIAQLAVYLPSVRLTERTHGLILEELWRAAGVISAATSRLEG